MHLLVAISNNIPEWRDTLIESRDKPRLPLPYAFGAAFIKRGHKLSAINMSSSTPTDESLYPFEAVYPAQELLLAMKHADVVTLWGGHGVSAILRQCLLTPPRKRVVLNSYVWQPDDFPTLRSRTLGVATQFVAHFAKAVVVMTEEQAELARSSLPGKVPVVKLRCGIDTAFYRVASSFGDVPEEYREIVERLLAKPYVIMPGDELRFNQDALDIIANSDLRLIRISQYSGGKQELLRREIKERGIEDRFFIFEKISYPFMRFLLQNASAYAGLVDSTWQPAGWTVACETMASGLPIVVYDGLVSRELDRLGASGEFMRSVPMRNVKAFQDALQSFMNNESQAETSSRAQRFASENLDFEQASIDFVMAIEKVIE
jgi:glycosyltransferase involved in cell wall biosynthesis